MLFRQFFDSESCTYTYLLAASQGTEAIIIDPVLTKTDHYLELIDQLDLKLAKAIDTHLHADHMTALGALRDKTKCITVMGKQSNVDVVSMRVEDGDKIEIEGLSLDAIYTPGHTDDSYCFYLPGMVFTGDTLLIRGTGRTDFQNGNALDAYDSLFNKLLQLPNKTLIYPGHDYKGDCCSTIGEEKNFNPRLQISSPEEYASIMDNLNLPTPELMDVVVPKNRKIGIAQKAPELAEYTVSAKELLLQTTKQKNILFIDLREETERRKIGVIPNSVHVPYKNLTDLIRPGGFIQALTHRSKPELMLYCAYGERSAMALKKIQAAGFENTRHLGGGIRAWINANGPIEGKKNISLDQPST